MGEGIADPRMQQFMNAEGERQRFQQAVHSLTDQCWDTCVKGTPGQKLERKQESCIVNCVARFLDISNFVVHKLEKEGEATIAREGQKGISDALPDFKWQQ